MTSNCALALGSFFLNSSYLTDANDCFLSPNVSASALSKLFWENCIPFNLSVANWPGSFIILENLSTFELPNFLVAYPSTPAFIPIAINELADIPPPIAIIPGNIPSILVNPPEAWDDLSAISWCNPFLIPVLKSPPNITLANASVSLDSSFLPVLALILNPNLMSLFISLNSLSIFDLTSNDFL